MNAYGPKQVRYPTEDCEAEIQARIWMAFLEKGLDARMEVAFRPAYSNARGRLKRRTCHIDIVVFSEGVALFGIEVKRPGNDKAGAPGSQSYLQRANYT